MSIKFLNTVAVDENVLFVDTTNDRVGIGTDAPLYRLQVQDRIHIEDTTSLQPKISFSENTNTTGEFVLEYNGAGSGVGNYVSFYSEVSGWVGKGNGLNYIPQSGYVGIGTTSPGEKLEVDGNVQISGDLTANGGDIILGGTGRIQGVDTVSANTDAANKLYVDNAVSGVSSGVTSVATTNGITGGTITSTGTLQVDSTVVRTSGTQTVGGAKTFTGNVTISASSDNMLTLNQTGTDTGWSYVNFNTLGARNYYVGQDASKNFNIYNDNIDVVAISVSYASNLTTIGGDLTVSGGDIVLSGAGRIQGVDTVSASTDAANKAYVDNAVYTPPTAPAASTTVTTAVVGETIEVTFNESATSDIDYYQVWSADPSGNFGIIAQIVPGDFASTMTVVDTSFNVSGTISYRVYAVKLGIYSTAATSTQVFLASALSVTAMTVVNLNTAYYVQYEKPSSRFISNIEIYMDSQATQAALNRSNASIVYSGQNASYMRNVGASNNFHQFWVEVTTT